jgi:DNA-directed RNA polymerase subunit RPC12/RpoP
MLKCYVCGDEFEPVWSAEEANVEAEELWGVKNASENPDMVVVCDYCWPKIIVPRKVSSRWEKIKAEVDARQDA